MRRIKNRGEARLAAGPYDHAPVLCVTIRRAYKRIEYEHFAEVAEDLWSTHSAEFPDYVAKEVEGIEPLFVAVPHAVSFALGGKDVFDHQAPVYQPLAWLQEIAAYEVRLTAEPSQSALGHFESEPLPEHVIKKLGQNLYPPIFCADLRDQVIVLT